MTAYQRIERYLVRRTKHSQLDQEIIHSLDMGGENEAILYASDIMTILFIARRNEELLK